MSARTPAKRRIALVTGAGAGIGRALAQALGQRGDHVVVTDINPAAAEAVAQSIRGAGGSASSVPLDVADGESVGRCISESHETFGRLDFLFNNAGICVVGEARHLKPEDWTRQIDVNLRGVIHGVSAAYPLMIAQGFGHIVNIASTSALTPSPFMVGYSTTKYAVLGLSVGLRAEAAQHGVRVSVVCPGFIKTDMMKTQQVRNAERSDVVASVPIAYYPADRCARDILRGVDKNRELIYVQWFARWTHRVRRWAPWAISAIAARVAKRGLTGKS